MPHIIVKLWPGRTEEQKAKFAEEIVKAGMSAFGITEDKFSVSMEEIQPDDWSEKCYKPDIIQQPDKLYKKPGYKM